MYYQNRMLHGAANIACFECHQLCLHFLLLFVCKLHLVEFATTQI